MSNPSDAGMSSLLMQAAHSAAQADGLAATPQEPVLSMQRMAMAPPRAAPAANVGGGGGKKKGPPLRRGKWTPEEEAYANRLIQEFKAGLLPLTDGTTLRTFLSKLLNCDPMRISKKFVGSNCIGKQVFRRRTADLNRLTPEQIQQSRAELSELERRFLERVAQTNRVKSSGVGGPAGASVAGAVATLGAPKEEVSGQEPPNPPWLQPPIGYKHGAGAAFAASNLSGANSRAAAAGRALLGGGLSSNALKAALERKASGNALASSGSAGILMAEMQRRASQQNMLRNLSQSAGHGSLLAAAAARSGSSTGLSNAALAQLAQNASAARLAGLSSGANSSMSNLLKGLSRDQLSQLARDRGMSSNSLTNMIQRQNSFDALMSLDFQSLQSIDNLANLIQSGGGVPSVPESGMKNADFQNLGSGNSSGDLSSAARRLASAGRMDSFLRNLSSSNMRDGGPGSSSANLAAHVQAQQQQGGSNTSASMASLLGAAGGGVGGSGMSAADLANLLRQDSSTGLSALRMQDSSTGLSAMRMQDGLNQRNSSVDDFLSLVAAGDIPHQDPSLLNVPLTMQQNSGSQKVTAEQLAQQILQANASGNAALVNALASRSFSNLAGSSGSSSGLDASALLQARAAAATQQQQPQQQQSSGTKRKSSDVGGSAEEQGNAKR